MRTWVVLAALGVLAVHGAGTEPARLVSKWYLAREQNQAFTFLVHSYVVHIIYDVPIAQPL